MRRLALLAIGLLSIAAIAHAEPDAKFPRGARRSAAHHVLNAPTHQVATPPPAEFALAPQKLDMWGNADFGDCVSAEEAFCKACNQPEIFIDSSIVVDWARQHGYLNGADPASVLASMQSDGFKVGGQQYNDGPYSTVDYSNETVLQSAIATSGPVKIVIDASALPSGAGNANGWFALGDGQHFPNTDHCVSVCAYGTADYLFSQINTPLPATLPGTTSGYLVFTWSTLGFVDHPWLMSTCTEAWVRNPATVGKPPLTPPSPNPQPPAPNPQPPTRLTFAELVQLVIAALERDLTPDQAAGVATFFADDDSPRVSLLKSLIRQRAVEQGLVPAGTSIEAINWQQLIKIITELEPIIVPLIPVLFGHDQAALIESPFTLCAAEYRTQCDANGCRRVRVDRPAAKPVKPSARFRSFQRTRTRYRYEAVSPRQ